MKTPFPKNINQETLFIWLLHRISEDFGKSAILKGGMSLYLLSSTRETNDLDFVFVPYTSKKEILPGLEKILEEIPGGTVKTSINSKALRIFINVEDVALQIEANVAQSCKTMAISTENLAKKANVLPRTVLIMDPSVAFSHKIAAWNERRLMRDLYDIYFMVDVLYQKPDMEVLLSRLSDVQSRLPSIKNKTKMTMEELLQALQKTAEKIQDQDIKEELSPIFPQSELSGMHLKIKASISKLIEMLTIKGHTTGTSDEQV